MRLMNQGNAGHRHEQWRRTAHAVRIFFLIEDRVYHEDSAALVLLALEDCEAG